MTTPIAVLLFEDDEGQAFLTKEALEKEHFVVDIAGTGREGLEQMLSRDHRVYLIDMQLPDLRGVDVLRRIATAKPGAVCIIVTGHGDEAAAVEAMKLGAYDYIVKSPYMGHLAALPVVVREGLERQQLKAEREELQHELWEHARLLEERNAELRRTNEELRRVDQLKSDLVSMVSHELRTPLTTIKEFTAILADKIAGPLTTDQQEYLGIVKGNVDRLGRIIDDLLDMAKIDAGRIVLSKQFAPVGPLLEHVVQSLQPLAEHKQITLTAEPPQELTVIFADPDKLTQIFLNLVSNAIKFTPGPGRVTIRVKDDPAEVQFHVSDTGVGIVAEDLPKLFEKFQQFRGIPSGGSFKGTGLGLAISKRLVELHGGRIWAESAQGQGSTFSFAIPKYHMEEAFREYLRMGLEQARRKQAHFSIIVVGLLNFQELKTLYGVEETSRLLKELEQALNQIVRHRAGGDVVVRWQRGEMVVVLAEVDQAGAQAITERILAALEGRTVVVAGHSVVVHVATATATYPEEATTEEELIKVTDSRLARAESAKARIMVIDDEPKIRQFLKEALELRDYEVLTAASGPDALEHLKSQRVDLILLDLMMPVMDGYEVYHLLKEDPLTKDVPVIIVTAKGERKDRALGLESASYNYVAKPFQLEDLVAKVREVLQQHAVRR